MGKIFLIIAFIILTIVKAIRRRPVKKKFEMSKNGDEEFEQFYKELVKSDFGQLKKNNEVSGIPPIVVGLLILVPILAFCVFADIVLGDPLIPIFVAICCGVIIIADVCMTKFKRIYNDEYKKNVIANIVSLVDKNLRYFPQKLDENGQDINISDYKDAMFDTYRYEEYYFDDFIKGKVENMDIEIVNIKTEHTAKIEGGVINTTVFEGMFAKIETKKVINNTINIKMKNIETDKFEMDSDMFNKYFDVNTKDRMIATRILTHDLMEVLAKAYRKIRFEIVIKQDRIYLRFFTGEMFEPVRYKSIMNKEVIYAYYYILKFILEVSREISKAIQILEV